MEKGKMSDKQIRWLKYSAQIACLVRIRDEGLIGAEEYIYYLEKIRDNYRDILIADKMKGY